MDTIQTIILTSVFHVIFTGLVGGIVIYTLQKKIDATIQRSLFEHQTKFARSFPKSVEALEALYKKVSDYSSSYSILTYDMELVVSGRRALLKDDEFRSKAREAMISFFDGAAFFRSNRIYFPEASIGELEEMIDKLHGLDFYLTCCESALKNPKEEFPRLIGEVIAERYKLSFLRFTAEMPFQNINPANKDAPAVFLRVIRDEVKR